ATPPRPTRSTATSGSAKKSSRWRWAACSNKIAWRSTGTASGWSPETGVKSADAPPLLADPLSQLFPFVLRAAAGGQRAAAAIGRSARGVEHLPLLFPVRPAGGLRVHPLARGAPAAQSADRRALGAHR